MILLALNRKELLVKLPLREDYLNEENSTYSCYTSNRLLILGIDDGLTFSTLSGSLLSPAERYAKWNPQFDFSIFSDADFRDSGCSFSVVLPKKNPIYPKNPLFASPVAINNGVFYFNMLGIYHNEKLRFWVGTTAGDWVYLDLPFLVGGLGSTHSVISNALYGGNNEYSRYYIQSLDTFEKSKIAKLYGNYEFFPNP